ncbi:MAG: glycosyltransferase family 39 protein [Anaerolineae bacterium]|nr:glycosyltransferase family 39 protein [Anaerolineae bacterium]
MLARIKHDWLFWLLWLLISAYLVWGVQFIPFHPDESSWLYMSADYESFLDDRAGLTWDASLPDDYDQNYRLLNAPLPKYLLGLARSLAGYSPDSVSVDWDWSLDWAANVKAGALPPQNMLFAARLLNTLLFAAALAFFYFTAKGLAGRPAGLAAFALLAVNAPLLLHTRRAMSESALIFTVALSLWAILHPRPRPWVTGLAVALAVSAKLSAAPLFLFGLLAVLWPGRYESRRLKPRLLRLGQYLTVFVLAVYTLTPLIWRQPLEAGRAALDARLAFTQDQLATLRKFDLDDRILDTPSDRLVALLAHQFFAPPAFADVGNYLDQTAPQEAAYLSIPGHNLLRGFIGGSITLTLTIFSLAWTFALTIRHQHERRRAYILLGLGTLIMAAALLATIPVPIQRYGLPLTPFLVLWAALPLALPYNTTHN